ncbi:hypothetical protein BC828DRAFT_440682 [Blastocladiella britannica]|nr:hypothetical protein BC828DRAFT_440682 [Blastocladiella britannica]
MDATHSRAIRPRAIDPQPLSVPRDGSIPYPASSPAASSYRKSSSSSPAEYAKYAAVIGSVTAHRWLSRHRTLAACAACAIALLLLRSFLTAPPATVAVPLNADPEFSILHPNNGNHVVAIPNAAGDVHVIELASPPPGIGGDGEKAAKGKTDLIKKVDVKAQVAPYENEPGSRIKMKKVVPAADVVDDASSSGRAAAVDKKSGKKKAQQQQQQSGVDSEQPERTDKKKKTGDDEEKAEGGNADDTDQEADEDAGDDEEELENEKSEIDGHLLPSSSGSKTNNKKIDQSRYVDENAAQVIQISRPRLKSPTVIKPATGMPLVANPAVHGIPGGFGGLNPFFSFLSRERGNFAGITGNEAPRTTPLPRCRGLLAMPVSKKAQKQVAPILAKFRDEGFDIMLFHFDQADWSHVPGYNATTSIRVAGQTKFWYAKRFLTPMVVENYDYIFLWDDDVGLDADWSPTNFVSILQHHGVHVAQPALRGGARPGYPQYDTVRWHPEIQTAGKVGRFVEFIEVMFPIYSREAWQNCIWETIPYDGRSFWGVDNVWYPHCSSAGYCRFAVIDSMPVDHLDTRSLVQTPDVNLRELGHYFDMYKSLCKARPTNVDPSTGFRIFTICYYIRRRALGSAFASLETIDSEKHAGSARSGTCAEPSAWPGIINKPWSGANPSLPVPYPYVGHDINGPVGGVIAQANWTQVQWDDWWSGWENSAPAPKEASPPSPLGPVDRPPIGGNPAEQNGAAAAAALAAVEKPLPDGNIVDSAPIAMIEDPFSSQSGGAAAVVIVSDASADSIPAANGDHESGEDKASGSEVAVARKAELAQAGKKLAAAAAAAADADADADVVVAPAVAIAVAPADDPDRRSAKFRASDAGAVNKIAIAGENEEPVDA